MSDGPPRKKPTGACNWVNRFVFSVLMSPLLKMPVSVTRLSRLAEYLDIISSNFPQTKKTHACTPPQLCPAAAILLLSTCPHFPLPAFFHTQSMASGRSVPLVPLALPPFGAPLAMTTNPCEAISLRNLENQTPLPEHAPLPNHPSVTPVQAWLIFQDEPHTMTGSFCPAGGDLGW